MNQTAKSPFPKESRQGRRYLEEQNKTIEHDPKSYRMAVFSLTSAINDFAKRHKSCLGDMEEINRIMLVKEEKEQLDRNLWEVVEKQIDRLSRDSLARNMETKNTYNQYLAGYRKRFMLQGNPVTEVRNTSLPIALRKNFFMEKKQVLKPRQSIQLNESIFPIQPIHTFKSRQKLHLQQRHFKNCSSLRTCEKNPSTKQSMKKSCIQNEAQDRNKQVFISTCRENSEPKNILKTTIIHKIIKYHKEEIQKSKIQERVLMANNEIEDMKLRKKMKTWAKSEKYCK